MTSPILFPLPPEGTRILARRIVCDSFDCSPAYLSFTRTGGLVLFPFERELPSTSYISATLFVMSGSIEFNSPESIADMMRIVSEADLWYKNTSRAARAGEVAEFAIPVLYIIPRISSSDFIP